MDSVYPHPRSDYRAIRLIFKGEGKDFETGFLQQLIKTGQVFKDMNRASKIMAVRRIEMQSGFWL